jgi:hypothetical protein
LLKNDVNPTQGLKTRCSWMMMRLILTGPYWLRVADFTILPGSFTIKGLLSMKFTPLFFGIALIVASLPSLARGQTKSSTPPPPSLTKWSAKGKGKKAIPPPPPISSIKSANKRHHSSARMGDYTKPGRDVTGRHDLSAKSTGFYPVTKGADTVNPSTQQPASKPRKR